MVVNLKKLLNFSPLINHMMLYTKYVFFQVDPSLILYQVHTPGFGGN
jgi:hypothetical protein